MKLERGATGIRLMESVDDSSDHIAREILNVTPAFIGFVFSQMTDDKKNKANCSASQRCVKSVCQYLNYLFDLSDCWSYLTI